MPSDCTALDRGLPVRISRGSVLGDVVWARARRSGMIVPAMHPIVFIAMLHGAGSTGGPGDAAILVREARELLVSGSPAKAEVLLRRARELDSTQSEVDRLRARCRAALGQWVGPDGDSEWMPGDNRLEVAAREKPDSLYALAQVLLQKENIGLASRLAQALSKSNTATASHLKFALEMRQRQEALIAFHADLARRAQARGDLEESAVQWRLAWTAGPDDPLLRDQVQRSYETRSAAIAQLRKVLSQSLAAKDEAVSYEIASKAQTAFPGVAPFRKVYDSLRVFRVASRDARLEQINALADQGMEQEAMDAMDALVEKDPDDPSLELAQSVLQTRMQKRRKRLQTADLLRVCDLAVSGGDVVRASEVLADLRKLGAEGPEFDRIPARIDSLRATRKAQEAFDEVIVQARSALRTGDLLAARGLLQKALVLQPASVVAKGLMASLNQPKPAPPAKVAVTVPVATSTDLTAEDIKRSKELLLAGVAAYRAGEYSRAIESWKKVLEIDTGCVQAKKYLANVGLKQTRLK